MLDSASKCHNPNPQRRPSLEFEFKWMKTEFDDI